MTRTEKVDAKRLAKWGLPDAGDSKNTRGRLIVLGGSRTSTGAVVLAGEAALRVGAGKVGIAVERAIGDVVRTGVPEAGVLELTDDGFSEALVSEIGSADAVLFGPGFDDIERTRARLEALAADAEGVVVVDAFGVGALLDFDRDRLPEHLIINANLDEAALLLGRDLDDIEVDVARIAEDRRAVVNCYGTIASPDGTVLRVDGGGPGLGTAGSGDVLAGTIAGFAARGLEPVRAAAWGAWTHARAGDRLTERYGLGFLARELAVEIALAVHEV